MTKYGVLVIAVSFFSGFIWFLFHPAVLQSPQLDVAFTDRLTRAWLPCEERGLGASELEEAEAIDVYDAPNGRPIRQFRIPLQQHKTDIEQFETGEP